MTRLPSRRAAAGVAALALLSLAAVRPVPVPGVAAPATHEVRDLRGWRVHVEKALLEARPELARDTLAELDSQLHRIVRIVPEAALERLRDVPIWVHRDSGTTCMAYHPSARWLENNGFDPAMARSIEVGHAGRFLAWTKHQQPWMVLHELAHAYHHRVLGFDHEELAAAHAAGVEAGLYGEVMDIAGNRRPHYGATNPREFFAEASEAWFGTNDFYPFVRAELKAHDPRTAALIERLWQNPPH